ncbi:MAG: AarF/ABC1/UbiB kinase family protein [Candidatus Methanofastidiosa archaeon]|nr:AarF/ABC1/UbiB kinase family protein [Candidatus Methanofastidiosa archaeon]
MMSNLKKNVTYLNRYRQIAQIMTKHGMGYFVDQIGLSRFLPKGRISGEEKRMPKRSLAVTYRMILEELGPTYIKLGQILSTRPDIVSKEYVEEFSKLQDDVEPVPFGQISVEIEKELNRPLSEVFESIDEKPIASASIGQVHKAILKNGDKVAVKVQKPGIERTIKVDLEIMRSFSGSVGNMMAGRSPYKPEEIVEEFAKAIKRELDYNIEASNAKRFGHDFENIKEVKIPRIYDKYTTKRLLVMEYIDGVKVSNLLKGGYGPEERKRIADIGAKAILKMIYENGFFHADPHPANIFVIDKDTIAFLDFGIVGKISRKNRKVLISLLVSIINHKSAKIADTIISMTNSQLKNRDEFVWDIEDLLDIYLGKDLEEIDVGEFIDKLTTVSKQYGIKMPQNLVLLGKAILMIEGIGRQLDPQFNVANLTRPYAQKMVKEELGPTNIIREWFENIADSGEMLIGLPDKIDNIITNLGNGEFKVGLSKNTSDSLSLHFEKSINRLSFSIVAAGMILASSVLFMTNIGPKAYDMPIIGLLGFVISFALGIGLIRGIMQSGKL